MLTELRIENFAIIDRLSLQFKSGLITFTGETGAGKSIIIDAVETLLGGRADSTYVRNGSDRALVEGIFQVPDANRSVIEEILNREELYDEDEPDTVILAREIRLNGRNVARINGRSVNVSLLREVGEYLIDVHGQSEHLSLLRVSQHIRLLDNYAASQEGLGMNAAVSEYTRSYRRFQTIRRELDELLQAERDSVRRMDMLGYQINEIQAARLQPGEDQELLEERNRLANAEELASLTQDALMALDEGTPETQAATDLFGRVVDALNGLAKLDPSQTALSEQAQSIFDGMAELAISLRSYLEGIEFSPKRLDRVEERLALIHNLKRKYGDSIEEILAFSENAQGQMDAITNAGERIQELEAEQENLRSLLGKLGSALSEKRKTAAEKLSRSIENELNDLYMEAARFTVDFQRRPDPQGIPLENGERVAFDASGFERVEFLIAPNPGEGLKPLAKIASGGETSRLMLALKNVLAAQDQIPTLIFDEIDQGIGGRVGTVVGEKLWNLARQHQVLCITHLPQLAAFGEQHFQVQKHIEGERTITLVEPLQDEARLLELAQMLGEVSEGTLRSARELIQSVGKRTAPISS